MLNYNEISTYALDLCLPLMKRNYIRSKNNIYSYKPDQVGYVPASLENFCRPFWGIAPIISSGQNISFNVDGKEVCVFEYFRTTLLSGLDEDSPNSWYKDYKHFDSYVFENQNITELAGLMIGVYFAREQLWEPLSEAEKSFVSHKLYQMSKIAFEHSWPNNHYWFPLFTITVLKKLGYTYPETDKMLNEGLDFLDTLYIGDGWYKDGVFGRFDYYEAWSLHMYPLLWTLIADDSFDGYQNRRKAYISRTNEFLHFYTHWFAKNGANVPFGRSLSYRFAASCLFPVAVLAGCDIDPSLAGRITAKNIEFFKNNYYSESDILQEGYLYHAPGVVETYTSDGGAYWCCKTFLSLLIPKDHAFWQYDKAVMPSEGKDYIVYPKHDKINMPFACHNGDVIMYNNSSQHEQKFGSMACLYSKFAYSSACGFGCSTPDNISLDNMIGLITPDTTMTSHRFMYTDLGIKDGVMRSRHIPFSNDKNSVIDTWMLPLGNGAHLRVHKVTLSQTYFVSEGGFSLGRHDDYVPFEVCENSAVLENHKLKSWLSIKSNVPVKMCKLRTQSGNHMYAPLSNHPGYITQNTLEPGSYIFAGVYGVCDKNEKVCEHSLNINENAVELTFDNAKYVIDTLEEV